VEPLIPEPPKGSRYRTEGDDDVVNPYRAPTAPASTLKPLGSLAQSARLKQLNVARGILIFIGITNVALNIYGYTQAESLVRAEAEKQVQAMGPGAFIDEALLAQSVQFVQLISLGMVGVGVLFIVFGIIIKKFPVPVTVTGLVLYIGLLVLFAMLDPATLAQGIILKLIFIVALAKAAQAAFAYRSEQRALAAEEEYA
jgi:hypothetical protein